MLVPAKEGQRGFLMGSSFYFTLLKVIEVTCRIEKQTGGLEPLWYRFINSDFLRDFEPSVQSPEIRTKQESQFRTFYFYFFFFSKKPSPSTVVKSFLSKTRMFKSYTKWFLLISLLQNVCTHSERISYAHGRHQPILQEILGGITECLICLSGIPQEQTRYWTK